MSNKTFMVAVISGFLATSAAAQVSTFDNEGAAVDALDDLDEAIEDAAEREIEAFGTDGREPGTTGSIAVRATATDEETNVGIGLRYGLFDGVNGFDMSFAYAYSADDGGDATENKLLAGLDYRRNFGPAFFGYAQSDISIDRLADTVGEVREDYFVGAGIGYRIFNRDDLQWSIQAGPGYRYAELVGGDTTDGVAGSVSNNVFYSLTETVYVTNDTDVIMSEDLLTAGNEFAVNVSLGNSLSLRSSVFSELSDATDDVFGDAKNTFGLSVVYNFN